MSNICIIKKHEIAGIQEQNFSWTDMWGDWNALAIGTYPFWTTCLVNWKKHQSSLSTLNTLLSQSPDFSEPPFTHLQIMGLDHMLIRESFINTEYWVPPRSTETEWAFNKSYRWLLFTSQSKNTDLGGIFPKWYFALKPSLISASSPFGKWDSSLRKKVNVFLSLGARQIWVAILYINVFLVSV